MNGYLIGEEGPLVGLIIAFEEAEGDHTWSLGRDPETSDVVLEDPMVSRQHAIVRATSEGFTFENLSSVNPVTQNGWVISEPIRLKEGDILQIGSTFFRFSEIPPEKENQTVSSLFNEEDDTFKKEEGLSETKEQEISEGAFPSDLHFGPVPDTRWLLKVISGPNAGAEFAMHKSSTYLIGKDPNICDIIFQDLSVSRQHARLSIDADDNAFIEDLGSRNGVIVNGELIDEKQILSSQDLVALGTTTFLVIDRKEPRETIFSPPSAMPKIPVSESSFKAAREKEKKDWKEIPIPKKHLILAGVFGMLLFAGFFSMVALFKSKPVEMPIVNNGEKIQKTIEKFKGVQFSLNDPSGKLFLTGHVLTNIDHQELLYLLQQYPFIETIEDNVIIDEFVWENFNALLSRNPDWIGVNLYSTEPGKFVIRGYVPTLEEAVALSDYLHLNFEYLDKLENQVVIEKNLQTEIDSLLIEKGLASVTFELSNGEIIFSGRIDEKDKGKYGTLLGDFKKIPGIRLVKNFVIVTSGDTSRVDLSNDYKITGYSKRDEKDYFVVINGKILGQGDILDGMVITNINPKMVSLEKEGVKYRINYNLQ